jgi:hypothetical protein
MDLLTFLGVADYKPTIYKWEGKEHLTRYCGAAIAHFLRPDRTLVVVTDAAEAKHFETLADELANVTQPVPVPIPDGHREADLWTIFQTITDSIQPDAHLTADITNGFRSLPFLSFLVIAYLRAAKSVTVDRVLYGAYEARVQETNQSPIFDLTPFVTLLDWTLATDRFTRFGDARDLASLLRMGIPPGPQMGADSDLRELGKGLKWAAAAMEDTSVALRLARPVEAAAAAHNLVRTLDNYQPRLHEAAPPFSLLGERIAAAYRPLAMEEVATREDWAGAVRTQWEMIKWLLQKEQYVQALTLAREWIVSLVVVYCDAGDPLDYRNVRKPVEDALNNATELVRDETREPKPSPYTGVAQEVPGLAEVWNDLIGLRNDLAHSGMRQDAMKVKTILDNTDGLYPRLQHLAVHFGCDVSLEEGENA